MNKHNRILAAILALQIVVLAVVFWPSPSVAGAEGLFEDLTVDQVVRVTIHDGDGNRIVLAKSAAGWALPEADDYPVQGDLVTTLLDKIIGIRGDRVVAQTGGSHKRLKVSGDEYERLVELERADGTEHKLYLGTAPSYQVLHVRPDGRDAVYLALGMTTYDARAEATAWVEPVYFSVSTDQVVAFALENMNGTFEFEKDEAGEWTMQGLSGDETLNASEVNGLDNRIAAARLSRPLGKQVQDHYGMDAPRAVITLRTRDGEGNEGSRVLRVGAKWQDQGFVVKADDSPYYVLVAEYTVQDLVDKARADFLQLPPTPTPEPTP